MRRPLIVSVLATVLVLAMALPSDAWNRGGGFHHGHGFHHHHGFRSHVFIGPAFIGPWWWYPPYYYPYPYYAYTPPPVVVEQQPQVYMQHELTAPPPPPPPAAQAPAPQSFWYYCPSAKAYYPRAPSCPEAWIKVAPRP